MDKKRRVKDSEADIGDVVAEDAWTDKTKTRREQGTAVCRTVGTSMFNSQTAIPQCLLATRVMSLWRLLLAMNLCDSSW